MCGIIGYTGNAAATDILLNGLRRLEYRGYDSAGIAVQENGGKLAVVKTGGGVDILAQAVRKELSAAQRNGAKTGIAHTRWATHGPPTKTNAHPHLDATGNIALVHNGIIENFAALRERLSECGHAFQSETDSEVLVHLVGEFYEGDLFQAVSNALRQVIGTYGIAVVSAREPGRVVAARCGSPVAIGLGDGESIITSDAVAILSHTRQVVYLEDGDMADITPGNIDIRTLQNMPVSRPLTKIDWQVGTAERGGYEHFMLKEIHDQPESLSNGIRGRLDENQGTAILAGLDLTPFEMAALRRIVLLGCGTSLHSAMLGKFYFEDLADLPAEFEQAAEFRYRNPILGNDSLVIAISQSGETADTLAAVREAKQKGALIAGLCNIVGSTIARETGRGVYLHAGPEISVASTKAFTSQITLLLIMALKFARTRRLSRQAGLDLCAMIGKIPDTVRTVLATEQAICATAQRFAAARNFFFIGRGVMYPVALEGALKLKEISYIHAEGYHAAELKHGPIALLEPEVPVLALACDIPGKEKTIGNIQECRARKAPVIAVVTEGDKEVRKYADAIIEIPAAAPLTCAVPAAVALQLFAYHMARLKDCPIDRPRNLAKSVTVE